MACFSADESELKKLDSGVKKNTTLVKKLRQVTEDIKTSLLEEIRRTNQTKYVDEAVAAFVESNFKAKDLPAILQVSRADLGHRLASHLMTKSWSLLP